MFTSDVDSARYLIKRIEDFCAREQSSPYLADLRSEYLNTKGNIYVRVGAMDSAIVCFTDSYKQRLQGMKTESVPDILINLADACSRQGKYDVSAFWYRKALQIGDSLGISEGRRHPVYYGLAQVYMALHDFDQCDYYYNLAGMFYDKMLPYEKYIYLNNRGNSYYFRADYPNALEFFRKSLLLARSYPDMIFEEHLTEMNLGETFLLMNQVDSAAYYLNLCSDFFRSIENQTALYYLDTQLIELALKQNNLPLARKRMSEAIQPDYVEPNMQHIRNRYLQHYFEEVGDFKQAYYYQMENQRIDDSTRNERIKMRTAEIDLKYSQDTTLMKQKIFIQQKENEVLALNQTLYLWMFACICILGLAVFVYTYNKRQRFLLQMRSQNMIATLRMENIRNRVSPHFIFNILNREMGNYTDEQVGNMRGLVKLMRRNLELTEQLCVTMAEELDFVNTFINLEREALGDSFILSTSIDAAIHLDQEILPSMMIQIPIENAIKHALKDKEGMKRLWVDIRKTGEGICVKVRDNGGGYRVNSANYGTGTGIKVILQTIQLLNANNKKHIDISITNVQLEDGETGCEFAVFLPHGYDYNLKKMV